VKLLSGSIGSKSASKIILWDQNIDILVKLKKRFGSKVQQNSLTFLSKTSYGDAQLAAYLKQQKVDIFINLKAFSAATTEPLDPSLSFEAYLEENERFSKVAQDAGVKNYFFMTQQAPHCDLAARLAPLCNHVLKDTASRSKLTYAMINLPYVIHGGDQFFQGRGYHHLPQSTLPVTTPAYGAYMMGSIMGAILDKESQGSPSAKDDLHMETVSYDALSQFFSILNHHAPMPIYSVEEKTMPSISWNEKTYKELKGALSLMEYKQAREHLDKFYA